LNITSKKKLYYTCNWKCCLNEEGSIKNMQIIEKEINTCWDPNLINYKTRNSRYPVNISKWFVMKKIWSLIA